MLKIIKESKNPEILIITPLKNGDKISRLTKKTIKRNDIPYLWVSYESSENRPTNLENGLKTVKKKFNKIPKFFLPLDNNIELGRHFIDRLYFALKNSSNYVGYAYGNLSYRGEIVKDFPAKPFNLEILLQQNYISSNSMFKLYCIEEVGFIKDNSMQRLLDWALLIQLARHGYFGIPVSSANHTAHTTKDNISAKDNQDYVKKYNEVYRKIILPFLQEIKLQNTMQTTYMDKELDLDFQI